MIELMGKMVIVDAMGITYTGRLVEVGEEDVYLETESGWVVIPTENITGIRESG